MPRGQNALSSRKNSEAKDAKNDGKNRHHDTSHAVDGGLQHVFLDLSPQG
jgi:hypothetical protein